MVKGCERDTDHDGNCPLHPKGCPTSTLSEYIAPRTPLPWEPSFSHSYPPGILSLGQHVAEFEWSKDRAAAVQAVNEAPALRARVAELEAKLAEGRILVTVPSGPHPDGCFSNDWAAGPDCNGDGHYVCKSCKHYDPAE